MRNLAPILLLAAAGGLVLSPAARADVRPFAADAPAGVSVSFDPAAQRYVFLCDGTHQVAYALDLNSPELVSGMLRVEASVDGGPFLPVVTGAGTRYRSSTDRVLEPDALAALSNARLVDHRIEGGAVILEFEEQPAANLLQKTFRLRAQGLSLAVEASSACTFGLDGYAGFSLGWAEAAPGARVASLPYLPDPVALFPGGEVVTALLDPTVSSGVEVTRAAGIDGAGRIFAHGRSLSEPDTAGTAAPLHETAFVTVSRDLFAVFPRVTGPASPYRASLSSRLVLDVWDLNRSFPSPEGVALSWVSPEAGAAHVSLAYADANPACGDGVRLELRHQGRELARLAVANGDTTPRTFEADIALAAGDEVRLDVDRAGNNGCDSTAFVLAVDTPSDLFASDADFSSVQGQRGFSYLEYRGAATFPMTWDPASSQWKGAGAWSLLWQGGGHPGQGPTSFLDAETMARRYREYGLTSLAIIFHVWQRWGYDAGLPDHYPANPALGAGSELAAFIATAKQAGMLVALHENYTDLYPDNPPDYPSPLYDPTAVALDRRGNPTLGWLNEGTGQQAVRIAARRMRGFATGESPSIAADYGANAAYIDVTTGWSPGMAIDHDAAKGAVPTLADAHAATVDFFDAMKGFYGGPLLGEGGEGPYRFDTYFAGSVDAVERQVEGRFDARVQPDYELAAVRPRMLNHGLGYYSRYFFASGQTTPTEAEADLDQYRATEIAFGHAGFLGDAISGVTHWMGLHAPEYWLVQQLQTRYADAGLVSVTYADGAGSFLDLAAALRADLPFTRARVRLEYDNGLVVFVNRDSPKGTTSTSAGFSYEQGRDGWRYFEEDSGGARTPMQWDAPRQLWHGAGTYSLLTAAGGHPEGTASVRTFTRPVSALFRIEGNVEDVDTSCGDGILAEIRHQAATLWQCSLPEDPGAPCSRFDLSVPVAAGDEIAFRIEQKADNACDSTAFPARISWDDGVSHDWTVDTPDGARVLPPSGFVAFDGLGFRAWTARLGPDVVDFVECPALTFARARGGALTAIETISTDGAVAVVPGAFGDDLHGVSLTSAERAGEALVAASVRCDVNVRFLDARSAVAVARHPASGTALDLTWGDLPPAWRAILAQHPGDLTVAACDDDGNPLGSPTSPALDARGSVLLPGLAAEQTYLLRLSSECLASADCAPGLGCCAGRCVPESVMVPVTKEGSDVVLVWRDPCPAGDTVLRSENAADFGGALRFTGAIPPWRDAGAVPAAASYYYRVGR